MDRYSYAYMTLAKFQPTAKNDIHPAILADMNIPTARAFPSSILNPVLFYKWMSEPSKEGSALS